jgi:hypothetical protein
MYRAFLQHRERYHLELHQSFVREAKQKTELFQRITRGMTRDPSGREHAISEIRQQHQPIPARPDRPPFDPVRGHNPARYSPFDLEWSWLTCEGDCALYGPHRELGEIGAGLLAGAGQSASSVSSVGVLYYSPQAGTLYVTAQAQWVWGYASTLVYNSTASSSAQLRVYIEQFTDDFRVYTSAIDIFRLYEASYGPAGAALQADGEQRSVVSIFPTRPGVWYALWVDSVQHVSALGVADATSAKSVVDLFVAPISYFTI